MAAATLLVTAAHAQAPAGTGARVQSPTEANTQQIAQWEGRPVVAVRVVSDSGELIAENPPTLPLSAGHPYDSEAARASMRKLYATGDYADLREEIQETSDGLRVEFIAQRNLFISVMRTEGLKEPPSESKALVALRLNAGVAFREIDLTEALRRLEDALRDDGLYEAQVQVERHPDPATHQISLVFHVTPGRRAQTGAITLQNTSAFADDQLLGQAKLRTGEAFDSQKLQKATNRLRSYLIKQDYLGARATLHRGSYDAATNTVPLALEVVTGSRVRVEVTGAKIPNKELKRRVPIYTEGAVDPDLLLEGRRELRDYFERQGYFQVSVEYTVATAPPAGKEAKAAPEQVITYKVNRGPLQRLVGFAFEGNKYFDKEMLKERLQLQAAAYASPGRFSQRLLDADAQAIRDLYLANGFQQAGVTTQIERDYHGKENDLFVHFRVEEGQQTLVGKFTLAGEQTLKEDRLLKVIDTAEGQPYSNVNVTVDRDNILALYYNEGFPDAQFAVKVEEMPASENHPRIALTYSITEGTQIHVTKVYPGGYEHTRLGVISREVQMKPGEPLREGDVIETQRLLYNLNVFSRVTVAEQNPDGADPDKSVEVIVEEAKRYTFAYGAGIEVQRLGAAGSGPTAENLEASPRITLELAKANLTGRGDTLSFKIRASLLQGRALASYTLANVFNKPALSFQATLFADKSRDVTTFTSTRYEGSVQLAQKVSKSTSILYRYTYRKVLVDANTLRIAPEQIPLFSQPTLVSEFGTSWVRDRRDNPADATQGMFNSLDFSLAEKVIGSSASFTRIYFQNSSFHRLGSKLVFARAVRFGWQQTIGNTLSTEIPLPERFFAGGDSSLRGFGLNEAGPRDPVTGFPVGGQALFLFNQELRFPMRLPKLGSKLGGAIFYDGGNVFSRLGTITFRYAPSAISQSTGELSYFSHTVGFGFRYATPIGPVRVDLAYQINPPQFITSCTIGNPGCSPSGTQLNQIPHFQFFFNLGDVF
ncbi:MAG TPA: POTRA domain-containing protein [Candidatus Acidoferrum sp.]|nr:POTRA domain-containing protein [Candidatus Acidoferrum sp.]